MFNVPNHQLVFCWSSYEVVQDVQGQQDKNPIRKPSELDPIARTSKQIGIFTWIPEAEPREEWSLRFGDESYPEIREMAPNLVHLVQNAGPYESLWCLSGNSSSPNPLLGSAVLEN